jgi:hypothetical protein
MITQKFGGQIDFISKYKMGTTFFYTFLTEDVEEGEIVDYINQVNLKRVRSSLMRDNQSIIACDN